MIGRQQVSSEHGDPVQPCGCKRNHAQQGKRHSGLEVHAFKTVDDALVRA